MNSINLIGRLTKDPEYRKTTTGKAVTSISLAVDREFNKNMTDFFDIVAWGQEAEFAAQFFHKGDHMGVKGRVEFREYTDRQGQTRKVTEVIAERVELCERKKPAPVEEDSGYGNAPRDENAISEAGFFKPYEDDGELPF